MGRWVVLDLPMALYADLDTGSMAARSRLIGALVLVVGLGAGLGAGVAGVLGRSVEAGAATGLIVACLLAVGYLLLVISVVAGTGLMFVARTRMKLDDEDVPSRRSRIVATLWVVAAYVGIVAGITIPALAITWFKERPHQGALEHTTGTVLSWDDGSRYRRFLLEYEADGQVRTGQADVDELDLTIDSHVGDTVALEYPVGHPDRIRGAGSASEGRETSAVLALVGTSGVGITAGCAATAVLVDRRRRSPM